jgi:nucleotide-binding universal stress UspA family protein
MEAASQKVMMMGADVHTIIEVGKPEDVILEVADKFQCDAIVVGRPDRSRFDRMVMGSVSQNLVESADCPVIIVPTPAPPEE